MYPNATDEERVSKEASLLQKLWGDYFVDPKTGKITSKQTPGTKRCFNYFVLRPIKQLINAIMNNNEERYNKLFEQYGITLKRITDKNKKEEHESELRERELAKAAMYRWLPASKCIFDLITEKLPSPAAAQKYRSKHLYTAPIDNEKDATLIGMENCDPDAPLLMYISKMVPMKEGEGNFRAFGRVFSGTIKQGIRYKIMGSNYEYGGKIDCHKGSAQRIVTMMAKTEYQFNDVPCGNTCAIIGLDKYLIKTGTIVGLEKAYPIKDMKFAVYPIVQRSVSNKKSSDLQRLNDGLDKLKKADPCCEIIKDKDTKQNIIAGSGDLHLETLIGDLIKYMKIEASDLIVGDPIVSYRETVVGETEFNVLAKTSLNKGWVTVEPMPIEIVRMIENDEICFRAKNEQKCEQNRILSKDYGFSPDEISRDKKLMSYAPTENSPNWLINSSSGVAYLDECKGLLCDGYNEATTHGPLCKEPVVGLITRFMDGKFHCDSMHRREGDIIPLCLYNVWGAMLNSQPRLMEPIYCCQITVPIEACGPVYTILNTRRATIISVENMEGTPMTIITADLPVRESIGLDSELKGNTSGKALAQCIFDRYQVIDDDPYEEGSLSNKIVNEIRERKGIGEMPTKEKFVAKL